MESKPFVFLKSKKKLIVSGSVILGGIFLYSYLCIKSNKVASKEVETHEVATTTANEFSDFATQTKKIIAINLRKLMKHM